MYNLVIPGRTWSGRVAACTSSRLGARVGVCSACVSALSPHAPCAYLPALSRCGRFGRPREHGSASSGQWWHRMLPSSQARRGSVRLRLLHAQPAPLGGIGPTMHTAPASQVLVRRRPAAEGAASLDRSVNAGSIAGPPGYLSRCKSKPPLKAAFLRSTSRLAYSATPRVRRGRADARRQGRWVLGSAPREAEAVSR